MYVCMYVPKYVCMYVCMYVCIYVYIRSALLLSLVAKTVWERLMILVVSNRVPSPKKFWMLRTLRDPGLDLNPDGFKLWACADR